MFARETAVVVVVTVVSWLLHGGHLWLELGLAQAWGERREVGSFTGFVLVWGCDMNIEAQDQTCEHPHGSHWWPSD